MYSALLAAEATHAAVAAGTVAPAAPAAPAAQAAAGAAGHDDAGQEAGQEENVWEFVHGG